MQSDSRFWVRRYLAEGWSVLPIPKGEKGPRVPNWQHTTFTEADFAEDDNIGVRLGEPSGNLIDIDLDAPEAVAAARVLLIQSQRVHGRPGKPASHYWFKCAGLKSTRYTAPDGSVLVEIRSTGGQTVLPPSTHPSGEVLAWEQERDPMLIESGPLVQSVKLVATAALVARFWPKGARHEAAGALAGFLAVSKVDPIAIERLVKVAAELAKDEEASDRARFAGDTARKAQASPDNPHTGATKLAELIGDDPVKRLRSWFGIKSDGAVQELNNSLFWVRVGTDELAGNETAGGVVFQTAAALRLRYANQLVVAGEKKNGDDILKSKFDVWLSSSHRRQFETIGFFPPPLKADDTIYNLWRGFAVEPDPKPQPELRCARYLEHVRAVTCGGDAEIAEYVFDWMADCVQNPGRPGAVAIAMRGAAGAGKGFTARELGALFGRHFIQLDRTEHLTGKFNAHLSGKVIVFADEAIWAGSKHDLGPLKRLITEPTLTIERKGIDATDEANCIHLITATNEGWSVPAMMRERRWLVLDVLSTVAQNHAYFNALKFQQEHGGREALLAWLKARSITRNLLQAPKTGALLEQTIRSATALQQWWFEKLSNGIVFVDGINTDGAWPEFLSFLNAENDYHDYCHAYNARPLASRAFKQEWSELLPGDIVRTKRRCSVRPTRSGGLVSSTTGAVPLWGFDLPALSTCRQHFADFSGNVITWDDASDQATEQDLLGG